VLQSLLFMLLSAIVHLTVPAGTCIDALPLPLIVGGAPKLVSQFALTLRSSG
jgi:hypothetical protein